MVRDVLGDAAEWSVDTYIAAHAADGIWVANWQRAQGKRSEYPTPIPRPGDEEDAEETVVETYGQTGARPLEEIDEFFASVREG